MADFILLPPRPLVGEGIARLIRPYLPGLHVAADDCVRFLEQLAATVRRTFLVYRNDLPAGADVSAALRDGFRVGPGDRVVSVGVQPARPHQQAASL
jgi:hypothetical protein